MSIRIPPKTLVIGLGALTLLTVMTIIGLSGAWRLLWPGKQQGTVSTVAAIGGPFDLVTHDGKRFTHDNLLGKPAAIFFGFTHCPDVCPTTLFEMTQAMQTLGTEADRFNTVFVTVDPERDTQELLKTYLSSFDPRIIGLTGAPAAIEAVIKAYRVYARKVPLDGGGYNMDHTASVLLFDARGNFVGTLAYGENAEPRLAKLRRLARNGR
jgi:protein SCO1